MPANSISTSAHTLGETEPAVINGELHCALTGRVLTPDEAYWAPPLITTRQLLSTLFQTLFTAPGNLEKVLMGEQPNVPYAPEARQQLANRRTTEQVKLLGLLLLVAALIVIPIMLVVS